MCHQKHSIVITDPCWMMTALRKIICLLIFSKPGSRSMPETRATRQALARCGLLRNKMQFSQHKGTLLRDLHLKDHQAGLAKSPDSWTAGADCLLPDWVLAGRQGCWNGRLRIPVGAETQAVEGSWILQCAPACRLAGAPACPLAVAAAAAAGTGAAAGKRMAAPTPSVAAAELSSSQTETPQQGCDQ